MLARDSSAFSHGKISRYINSEYGTRIVQKSCINITVQNFGTYEQKTLTVVKHHLNRKVEETNQTNPKHPHTESAMLTVPVQEKI